MMMMVFSCSFETLCKCWWRLWMQPLHTMFAASNLMISSWPSRKSSSSLLLLYSKLLSERGCNSRQPYWLWLFFCWQVWSQTCSAAAQSLWRLRNHSNLCCRFPIQVLKHLCNAAAESNRLSCASRISSYITVQMKLQPEVSLLLTQNIKTKKTKVS